MGECGCGDFSPYKTLKVGDNYLTTEIYKGCEYCDTGLMVTLYIQTPEEADRWFVKEAAEKFEPDEFGFSMYNFPLLAKDDLISALKEIQDEDEVDLSLYGNFEDFLQDYGVEMIQRGVRKRLQINEEQEKKYSTDKPDYPNSGE